MAKARLYFDGDNTYIEKQARIYKMVDEIGEKIDNIPGVVNNLSSTSETDALSAAMGKELQDQINAMSGNFHFLSSWDCTTGLPGSDPATDPYTYQSGDYYIVSNVGSTNYKPHGSTYTHGVASTAVETNTVQVNDWYIYDGSSWILQPSGGAQIVVDPALSTTSTNPVENRVITQALNNKQDTIPNLNNVISGAAAGATALQPGDNITQLVNNAGYQTAGDVASAISGKQDTLTAGEGIAINNNVITNTGITCLEGGTDIEVVPGGMLHNLPTGYTELEYVTATGDQLITLDLTGDAVVDFKAQGVTPMSASNVLFDSSQSGSVGYYYGGLTTDNGIWAYTTIPFYTDVTAHLSYVGNAVEGTVGSASVSRSRTTTITRGTWTLFGSLSQTTGYQFPFYGRLYYFKATQNGTVTYNLIPAKNISNVAGLYDIVNNVFYTSSRTALTAGPEAAEGCTTVNFTNASGYMLKSSNKLIYATTDTAFNTRDKICTTADGNYSPTQGDVLALVFNNGCGVGSPRLDIDGSGLHSISVSTTGANAGTFWLGMDKISWLFIYDGNRWITWPIKNNTYDAGTGLSLSNGTFTNTQPGPTIGTTAPANPSEGAMWYDTTNHVLKVYNGTEWAEVGSGGGGGSTTWGNIGGILSNQTDLQDALDDKLEATDLIAGDGITIAPVGSELPTGYTQVAYLQSNGNAVIQTNITGIGKKIVTTTNSDVVQTAVQVFTGYNSDYLGTFIGVYSNRWCAQNASGGRIEGVDANTLQDLTISFTLTSGGMNKSDVTIGQSTGTFTRNAAKPDGNLGIFGTIESAAIVGSYIGKIYSYKVYDAATDALITELIPCLNDLSVPGFYDTANATFYPKSAGTGTISAGPVVPVEGLEISVDDSVWTDDNVVAGTGISIDTGTSARLPSGYTEVEWIQSDEHCGINSGKKIHEITKVETVGNFVQNNGGFRCVVGVDDQSLTENQGRYGVLIGEGTDGAWYIQASTYSSPKEPFTYSSVTPDTDEHTFSAYYSNGYTYISVDGIADSVAGNRPSSIQDNIGIFSRYVGASNTWSSVGSVFKMKSIKMWNGNTVVFDGVPCKRNSDDEIGLYDLTSGTFLENQKSGTFTAGPVVTFDPTKVISSTVLGFNNLTYDSFTSGTWTANATVAFPATAKMAFLNWRAKSTVSSNPPFACGQVLLVRGLTLVSSFVGGGNGTDYIYGGVGLDSASTYIDYTQANKTAGAAGIDYTIYFFK